jgi:hypothetical protein
MAKAQKAHIKRGSGRSLLAIPDRKDIPSTESKARKKSPKPRLPLDSDPTIHAPSTKQQPLQLGRIPMIIKMHRLVLRKQRIERMVAKRMGMRARRR